MRGVSDDCSSSLDQDECLSKSAIPQTSRGKQAQGGPTQEENTPTVSSPGPSHRSPDRDTRRIRMEATTKLCMKKFQRKRLYFAPQNTSATRPLQLCGLSNPRRLPTTDRASSSRLRYSNLLPMGDPALTVILILARTKHKDLVERRKA